VITSNPVPKNIEKNWCRWECHVGKTELQEEQHILDAVFHFFKLFFPRISDQYIHLLQPTK